MFQNQRTFRSLIVVAVLALAAASCTPAATAPTTVAPTTVAATMVAPATVAPTKVAPTAAAPAPAVAPLPDSISVAEAAALRDSGAFILDVRTPAEWNEVHIPHATLIPLDELEARVSEVPKDQEIVVVCRSGNRSQQGRDLLKNAGYTQVTSMSGGLNEWKAAGLPTVTGP